MSESHLAEPVLVVMSRTAIAIATTFLLSLAPGFEGRYATLVGVSLGLDPSLSLAVSCLGEVSLAIALSIAASYVDVLLRKLAHAKGITSRVASYVLDRVVSARVRLERYVRRWGVIGLTLFVAVPLPVTGVWTGALVGYLIGLDRRYMALSLAVGGIASVLIVGIPMLLASKLGVGMP